MVALIRNRNKFAREGLEMVVTPSLVRAAEMTCETDTKGLNSSSCSIQS